MLGTVHYVRRSFVSSVSWPQIQIKTSCNGRAFAPLRFLATGSPKENPPSAKRPATVGIPGFTKGNIKTTSSVAFAYDDSKNANVEDAKLGDFGTRKTINVRALVFNSKGEFIQTVEGDFSKMEICSVHNLQPRDLRSMDGSHTEQMPTILVRDTAILVNLLHVKALIKADMTILVANDKGGVYYQYPSTFVQELSSKLKMSEGSYEFRALETVLLQVVTSLQTEQVGLVAQINSTLAALDEKIDEAELKGLLTSRRKIDKFMIKVNGIRTVFAELLNRDDDLAALYLTDKAAGNPHKIEDHMEAELLFEHYLNVVDEISNATLRLSNNNNATQATINIILDSRRNHLMLYEIKATLATVAFSAGSLVGALFGMNLTSTFEHVPGMFWGVSAGAVGLMAGVFVLATRQIRRLAASGGYKFRKSRAYQGLRRVGGDEKTK